MEVNSPRLSTRSYTVQILEDCPSTLAMLTRRFSIQLALSSNIDGQAPGRLIAEFKRSPWLLLTFQQSYQSIEDDGS